MRVFSITQESQEDILVGSIALKTASAFHTSGVRRGTTESARRIVIKSRNERNLQRKKRSSPVYTILVVPRRAGDE